MVEVDFVFDSYSPPLSDESDFVFSAGELDPTAIPFTAEKQPLGGEGLQFTLTEDSETVSDDLSLSVEGYNNSVDPTSLSFSLGVEGVDDTLVQLEFRDQDQVSPTEFDLNLSIQEVTVGEFTQAVASTSAEAYDYPRRFESATAAVSVKSHTPEESEYDQSPVSVSLAADEYIDVFYPAQLESDVSAHTRSPTDTTSATSEARVDSHTPTSGDHVASPLQASPAVLSRTPDPSGFTTRPLVGSLSEYSVGDSDHLISTSIIGSVISPNFNSSVYSHVPTLGSALSFDMAQSPRFELVSVPVSVVSMSPDQTEYVLDAIDAVGALESQDVVAVFGYSPVKGGVKAYERRPVFGTSTIIGSASSHDVGQSPSPESASADVSVTDRPTPTVNTYDHSPLSASTDHLSPPTVGSHVGRPATASLSSSQYVLSDYTAASALAVLQDHDDVVSVYGMKPALAVNPGLDHNVSEYGEAVATATAGVGADITQTAYDMDVSLGTVGEYAANPSVYGLGSAEGMLVSFNPNDSTYIGNQTDAVLVGLVRGPEQVYGLALADSDAVGHWLGDPPTATKGNIGLWLRTAISTNASPREIWTAEKDPGAGLDL